MQFEAVEEERNEEYSKPGSYTAYNKLKAHHHQRDFTAQELVLVKKMPGGNMSVCTHTQGEVNHSTFFGRIKYFKIAEGCTGNDAQAVLTREPSKYFNSKEFEFAVYKLSIPTPEEKADQDDKLRLAFPSELKLEFDSRQRLSSNVAMSVVAKGEPVPRATVKLLNPSGQQVTHWTDAAGVSTRRGAVRAFIVTQHIRFEEGPQAGSISEYPAEVVNNGEEGYMYELSKVHTAVILVHDVESDPML